MLILGRRINQSIVFPNCGITVRILDVNGRVAKIGIEAPKSVEIMRGELASSPQSRAPVGGYAVGAEQSDAPESTVPVLQFAQRLAEIRAGLHLFQQRRAIGDEIGADQVLGDLLNDLANLDADSLKSTPISAERSSNSAEFVSESKHDYALSQCDRPIHVLVVNEPSVLSGFEFPAGTFHGCQVCTVNNRETALRTIESEDSLDYVVCNGSSMTFDELELVRTIRSERRLDRTKVFMTCVSANAKEQLELSRSYSIDGWLARPLEPQDLWKHIVESQQFEF